MSTQPTAPVPPLVDIIIPGFENLPLTRKLLQSIRQTTGVPLNVIYVDNGSSPYDVGQLIQDYPAVQVVRFNTNYGFVRAINAGMAQAFLSPAPFVLWLNNDVEVPKGDPTWLTRLLEPFQDETIAATGAVSDNVFGQQRYEKPGEDWLETPILIGFALCVRKSAAQTVGFLDEKFGIGNYEDWDYSLRLRARGWKLIAVESVWLHHKMHQTFNKLNVDMPELLARNLNILVEKWTVEKLADLGILFQAPPAAEPATTESGPSTADALTPEQLAETHHADELGATPPIPTVPATWLVTHATTNWLPKLKPYLDSLEANSPWDYHVLVVADHRNADISIPQGRDGKLHQRIVPVVPGAPERTASLQHGAFLEYVCGHADDVLIYTDGDIAMQRPPTKLERDTFEMLPAGRVLAGWNSGPYETLALEASRLSPRYDVGTVFDPRTMATAPCYNIGVIAARRKTWEAIHAGYMALYPAALAVFAHPARQQWLVCYVIAQLGIRVDVMPYAVHMHGCYQLPASGAWDGQMATFDGRPVLFRHHIP